MTPSVVMLIVAALTVFWALGAYNRLVRLRSAAMQGLQKVLQLWQQQARAVSEQLKHYAQGRETPSQWAALDEDALQWRPLDVSAQQFLACVDALLAKPQQLAVVEDLASLCAARAILELHWQRLCQIQDDLAGATMPVQLRMAWAQHEASLSLNLKSYNEDVENYHGAIAQFPALLLAGLFGFLKTSRL